MVFRLGVRIDTVETTEWSLPKNSLVTMDVLREACELETRTKSNRLHALRPSSSERKMCRRSGIYVGKFHFGTLLFYPALALQGLAVRKCHPPLQ